MAAARQEVEVDGWGASLRTLALAALAWLVTAAALAQALQLWQWMDNDRQIAALQRTPPSAPPDPWPTLRAPLPPLPPGCASGGERRVELDLRAQPPRFGWELELPSCHPLVARLTEAVLAQPRQLQAQRQALADALLGSFSLTGHTAHPGPLRQEQANGLWRLRSEAELRPMPGGLSAGESVQAYLSPPPLARVDTHWRVLAPARSQLWPMSAGPVELQDGRLLWHLPADAPQVYLSLQYSPALAPSATAAIASAAASAATSAASSAPSAAASATVAAAAASAAPAASPAEAPAGLWSLLRGSLHDLQPAWLALLLALPLLALRQRVLPWHPRQASLRELTQLPLVLAGLVAVAQSAQMLSASLYKGGPPWLQILLSNTWEAQGILQAVCLLGLVAPLRWDAGPRRPGVAVLLLAAAAGLVGLALHSDALVQAGRIAATGGALLLCLLAFNLGLLPGRRHLGWLAALMVLALGLVALSPRLPFEHSAWLVLPLAALFGHGLVNRLAAHAPAWQAPRWAWLGALAVVVMAWPPQGSWAYFSLLGSASWTLAHLGVLALLMGLGVWLMRRRAPDAAGSAEIGVWLLGLWMFWHLGLTPLGAVLGAVALWALARHLLFAPRRSQRGLAPSRLARSIRRLAMLQAQLRARRDFLKGLGEQLAKGALDSAEYQQRLQAYEEALDASEQGLGRCRALIALTLNAGDAASPAQRAWRGAAWGGLLALPWMAYYLWGLAHSATPTLHAHLVDTGVGLAQAFLLWPLLGAFFGYFYPQLRGLNGMAKGLVMSAVFGLPALAQQLVGGDHEAWRWTLLWILQLFVLCMLLGVLLGDLPALRRTGKGLRSLFEIYNLGALTAWGSGLVLAIGGSLSTLLAGQTGSLVVKGVEALFVQKPGG